MESKLSKGIGYLIERGQFEKASSHATFLIDEAIRTNNIELQLTSYIQRLKLNLQQQAIAEATDDLHKCEQPINNDPAYERYGGVIYCASGILNTLTNNPKAAFEQFAQAIAVAHEHHDWLTVSTAYTKMSVLPQIQPDEAIRLARTGVLFAQMIEQANELYVARALLHLVQLYLQTEDVTAAFTIFETLKQLLDGRHFVRENMQTKTLWLQYYVSQRQFDIVLTKAPALLKELQLYNQFDLRAQVLELVMETYQHLEQPENIAAYEQEYNELQVTLQQYPVRNQLTEQAPSYFTGLSAFKEEAQQHLTKHEGCSLLLFYIESDQPLPYEQTAAIFEQLHFFLAQTNITILTHNIFETHKALYVVREGFRIATPFIQQTIEQTLLNVTQPVNILFGHTHNIEHETYTFDECLAICHAYLYYNQWALAEKVER